MNDFWAFAGHYWWLVFPVLGMAGGLMRTASVRGHQRHRERMERMRLTAELETARQARAVPIAPVVAPPIAPPADATFDTPTASATLTHLIDAHDDVTHRWLDYELDVAKLIAFPSISDGRQPLTAAFLRAKKIADRLRPDAGSTPSAEQLAEYRAAVTDYEVAFDVAERDARRVRDSEFSASERKRLETARQLIGVAIDQAATPAERQLAYRRVRDELNGLISVSDEAIDELEKKVALQLPAAPEARS